MLYAIFFIGSTGVVLLVYLTSSIQKRKFLTKWLAAALVAPIVVAVFQPDFVEIILLFWPGSIVLMSLGSQEVEFVQLAYVWGAAISLNIALYIVIGLGIYYASSKQKPDGT